MKTVLANVIKELVQRTNFNEAQLLRLHSKFKSIADSEELLLLSTLCCQPEVVLVPFFGIYTKLFMQQLQPSFADPHVSFVAFAQLLSAFFILAPLQHKRTVLERIFVADAETGLISPQTLFSVYKDVYEDGCDDDTVQTIVSGVIARFDGSQRQGIEQAVFLSPANIKTISSKLVVDML